jgi:hypothetical protein
MYLHLFLEVKGGLMLDFIISQCEVILQLHSIKGKACSLCLSASSIFLSQQTSHQQPVSSTFLSEQTSTSHQPPAKRTG